MDYNYVSIKETDNGFIVEVNNYSQNKKRGTRGTFVARSVEELKEVLEKEVYPVLNK